MGKVCSSKGREGTSPSGDFSFQGATTADGCVVGDGGGGGSDGVGGVGGVGDGGRGGGCGGGGGMVGDDGHCGDFVFSSSGGWGN